MRSSEKNLVCAVCGANYKAYYEPKIPRCALCKQKRKAEQHRNYMQKQRDGCLSGHEVQRITAENAKISAIAVEAAAHHMSYGKYVEARRAGTV